MEENQFLIENSALTGEALEKKRRLEQDPSSRADHMAYMEGMEQIRSDVRERVMAQMAAYDYDKYTAADVAAALSHDTCTIEDFKALLSPAALHSWKPENISETVSTYLRRFILPTIVKTIVFTADLTAIIRFTGKS